MIDSTQAEANLQEELFELIVELCCLSGAPGFEQLVVGRLAEKARPFTDSLEIDAMGNLYAWRRSNEPRPLVMISAHSDEIGAVVRAVEPSGFLRLNKLGGTLDTLLVGRKVMVDGHLGVVGVKAGHAQSEDERSRVPDSSKLYIDVGADSAADVAHMGIRVGDPITYVSEVERLTNRQRICGKGLDNRLGCAVLLTMLKRLEGASLDGTLCAVVTVQEEIGLRGAQIAARHVKPDFAVVVDTIPCGDTPDMERDSSLPIGINRGPVFRVVSRGDVMHPGMKRLLIETAEAEGIPYQLVVHDRSTTDASAIHVQEEGIPTAVVTIPRRYSHSPVEVCDLRDVTSTLHLLEALVRQIGSFEQYRTFV